MTALLKKNIFLFFALCMAQNVISSSPEYEKYRTSLKKWMNDGVVHYNIILNYSAFSPLAGIWELEVENGNVVFFIFNGVREKRYAKFAAKFTMEALYKTAGYSVKHDEKSPMIITAEYDLKTGYIKSIRRMNNPAYRGRKMKDAGYFIQIVELRPLL